MNLISEKIVDFLVHNRVSTTEVADVLCKSGALEGIHAINRGHYRAGIVKYVYAYDESNWPVHEQVENIEEDRIIFVDAFDCGNRAIFGELVSKYLILYRQSRAIIVNGNMRDAAELYRENYPIWCKGFTPIGCFNKEPVNELEMIKYEEKKEKLDGAIAVCDDCGVVIIPKNRINEEMLTKLQGIENQEDIWFDRLNHFKDSTFEIVCRKSYLDDKEYMKIRKKIEDERIE
jgi:regulator of RNase E activity RraA